MLDDLTELERLTICGVCLHPLDYRSEPDLTVTWSHPIVFGPQDHDPFPVTAGDPGRIDGVCDWCSSPEPRWIVPVKSHPIGVKPDGSIHFSDGSWATCDPCLPLVTADDFVATARRFCAGVGDMAAVDAVAAVHRRAMTMRDGGIVAMRGRTSGG